MILPKNVIIGRDKKSLFSRSVISFKLFTTKYKRKNFKLNLKYQR